MIFLFFDFDLSVGERDLTCRRSSTCFVLYPFWIWHKDYGWLVLELDLALFCLEPGGSAWKGLSLEHVVNYSKKKLHFLNVNPLWRQFFSVWPFIKTMDRKRTKSLKNLRVCQTYCVCVLIAFKQVCCIKHLFLVWHNVSFQLGKSMLGSMFQSDLSLGLRGMRASDS